MTERVSTNLLGETGEFAFFGDDIGRAEFQVGHEVLADGLIVRQGDRTDQCQQRPVPQIHPRVHLSSISHSLFVKLSLTG